jgi:hypothetical protein
MQTQNKTAADDLESGANIARKLDLHPGTIKRFAREGMPHHDLGGGLIRYRFSEVLEWLARRPRKTSKRGGQMRLSALEQCEPVGKTPAKSKKQLAEAK